MIRPFITLRRWSARCATFAGFIMLALLTTADAWAIDSEAMEDPVLQARYVTISKELRCLVCQNQSIQDSNAELAKDLRRQVRGMLDDGKSDDEIYRYMTERYGDYVRYRPPWRLNTLLLQLGPFAIALFAVWMLWGTIKRHRSEGEPHVTNSGSGTPADDPSPADSGDRH